MSNSLPSRPVVLAPSVWRARRDAHRARLEPLLRPQIERRGRQEKHPVLDFLFDYYPFRASHLLRWTPGLNVCLEEGGEFLAFAHFAPLEVGVGLPPAGVPGNRVATARRTLALLEAVQARPAFHGCLGLHEWAMVYEESDVRHTAWPLRLTAAERRRVVEAGPVRCTHFDAFRFFSRSARPLNQLQPGPRDRADFEQPGCIHANMDLYKHAYKLHPWLPAELVADCFLLACRAREIDMRASPYDLSALGHAPIAIETPAGQAEYRAAQRAITAESAPLRARLIGEIGRLLALTEGTSCATGSPEPVAHE